MGAIPNGIALEVGGERLRNKAEELYSGCRCARRSRQVDDYVGHAQRRRHSAGCERMVVVYPIAPGPFGMCPHMIGCFRHHAGNKNTEQRDWLGWEGGVHDRRLPTIVLIGAELNPSRHSGTRMREIVLRNQWVRGRCYGAHRWCTVSCAGVVVSATKRGECKCGHSTKAHYSRSSVHETPFFMTTDF